MKRSHYPVLVIPGILAAILTACGGAGTGTGLLPNTNAALSRSPGAGSQSVVTGSIASTTSASPSAIVAGYPAALLDAYSSKFQWQTSQNSAQLPTLNAAGAYTDFYVSSIREISNYGGTQPSWSSVNLHEDAFVHSSDPATLTTEPTSGAIVLHWHADARAAMGVNVGGYAIYEGSSPDSLSQVATVSASANSYTASGLSDGSTYYFAVHSLLNGADSAFSWVESATSGTPSGFALDSPTYSTSGTIAPGATIALTVRVHASGSALPTTLGLQTEVRPTLSTTPSTATLSSVGNGYYQGSATLSIPSGFNGGIAFRIADSNGNAVLPAPGNQTYYVTSPNNRLHFGVFANNFLMDASSPAWQALVGHYIVQKLAAGYKGVLLDDTNAGIAQARPDALPASYSDANYLNGVVSEFKYLRSTIPSTYEMCANGLSNAVVGPAIAPYIQRGEIEEIAFDRNSWGFAPQWYWTKSLNNVLALQQSQPNLTGRVIVDVYASQLTARLYSLATYFLLANKNLAFDLESDAGFGSYYPEYAIGIGSPAQTFSQISDAWVASDGAFERTFTNGRVIVNPGTSTTPVINLNGSYSQATISGGSVQQGGTLSFTPVTSVQLGPDQAAILVGTAAPASTPTPAPTALPTQAPAPVGNATFVADSNGTAYSSQVFNWVSGVPSGLLMTRTSQGLVGGVGITVAAGASQMLGWLTASGTVSQNAWAPGSYTVTLPLYAGNPSVTLTKVEILRVSSLGRTVEGVVASSPESQALTKGTYTFNLSGSYQTSNPTDLLGVRFTVQNGSASSQRFYILLGPSGAQVQTPLV